MVLLRSGYIVQLWRSSAPRSELYRGCFRLDGQIVTRHSTHGGWAQFRRETSLREAKRRAKLLQREGLLVRILHVSSSGVRTVVKEFPVPRSRR